jgi:methionyl-tRNA formyltransferase
MAIAFAGTAEFARMVLAGLVQPTNGADPIEIPLVISQPDKPAGRGRKLTSPPVAQWARDYGLEVIQPERLDDPSVRELLMARDIDMVIVVAYGQIVREPLLSELMMLNVHASLLPLWRGAAPIERSIMAGDTETGVCIMRMEAGLDTGPVALRHVVMIDKNDDAGSIYRLCAEVGIHGLRQVIEQIADGTVCFEAQPPAGESYAHKIVASDRQLDVTQTAKQVHDTARALSPHIGAWLELDGQRVTVWKSKVAENVPSQGVVDVTDRNTLVVGCSDGAIELLEVQPAGKRRMSTEDWLRGVPSLPKTVTSSVEQA